MSFGKFVLQNKIKNSTVYFDLFSLLAISNFQSENQHKDLVKINFLENMPNCNRIFLGIFWKNVTKNKKNPEKKFVSKIYWDCLISNKQKTETKIQENIPFSKQSPFSPYFLERKDLPPKTFCFDFSSSFKKSYNNQNWFQKIFWLESIRMTCHIYNFFTQIFIKTSHFLIKISYNSSNSG